MANNFFLILKTEYIYRNKPKIFKNVRERTFTFINMSIFRMKLEWRR